MPGKWTDEQRKKFERTMRLRKSKKRAAARDAVEGDVIVRGETPAPDARGGHAAARDARDVLAGAWGPPGSEPAGPLHTLDVDVKAGSEVSLTYGGVRIRLKASQ